jgi:ABC-type xylose transport system permease subunit
MPGVYSTYGIYLPTDFLVWLSSSGFRLFVYRLQEFHALFRVAHILSMAIFFGSIVLLDLRLFGLSRDLALRQFAPHVLPWTYASFALAVLSGTVLFLFDPIQLASHTWFLPKLLLVALGLANAAAFRRGAWDRAVAAQGTLPGAARLAGAISASLWIAVMICASLNASERPLRSKRTMTGIEFSDPAKLLPAATP